MPIVIPGAPEPATSGRVGASTTAPSLPHCAVPFTLTRQGTATVEQGSEAHLRGNVYNIAVCPRGFRDDLPEFGVPSLLWKTMPLDLGALEGSLHRWEPEADLALEQHREAVAEAQATVAVSG